MRTPASDDPGKIARRSARPARSHAVIAGALAQRQLLGAPGRAAARSIATGDGWRLADVVCDCGATDPVAEESHAYASVAFVLGGAFQYRGERGSADLVAGAIMLGTPGAAYRCRHTHGAGDRCLAVQFDRPTFAALNESLGVDPFAFPSVALRVHRDTTGLFALAERAASRDTLAHDEGFELASALVHAALRLAHDRLETAERVTLIDARRVVETVREIERDPGADHSLDRLAGSCGMSRFHFLRRFRAVTGVTPHAYVKRARLREAARLLLDAPDAVSRVALDVGYEDLSAFNAAFRAQFGCTPSALRRRGASVLIGPS